MGKIVLALLFSSLAFAQYFPPVTSSGGGGGGSSTPCGSTTQIQYNNAGACGASANFTVDLATGGFLEKSHSAIGGSASINSTLSSSGPSVLFISEVVTPAPGVFEAGLGMFMQSGGDSTGTISGFQGGVQVEANHNIGQVNALYGLAYHNGTGTVPYLRGEYLDTENFGGGTVPVMVGSYSYMANLDGTVTNLYNYYAHVDLPVDVTTNSFGFYAYDMAGVSSNPYYSWYDSRGVGRCKEDNTFDSVGQSICVVYNPQFTKYTPGAADFERIIYGQWNGNVAEMGAEKGGTGTLRTLRLIGQQVQVNSLKTTGAATGKTVVCVDVATGQLYASTSGVACAN